MVDTQPLITLESIRRVKLKSVNEAKKGMKVRELVSGCGHKPVNSRVCV